MSRPAAKTHHKSPPTGTSAGPPPASPARRQQQQQQLDVGGSSPQRAASNLRFEGSVSDLHATVGGGGGGGHAVKKSPHFVLDSVKVKRVGVISNELLETKIVRFDTVTNTVTTLHDEQKHGAAAPAAASSSSSLSPSKTAADKSTNKDKEKAAADKIKKKGEAPPSLQFGDVYVVQDPLGAAAEIQLEVDKFFETGVPLVGTDNVPDADALVVVSAGPDGVTAAKSTLAAVETATRYMSHRSLCAHISCVALFGNVEDMMHGQKDPDAADGAHKEDDEPEDPAEVIPANVTMTDLLEHGATKHHRTFSVSEPCDPFWDRYSPKHLLRIGLSSNDIDDKLATLRVHVEDQIAKNYSRAMAFLFFVDCIHFRDGFHRFTKSDPSSHATSQLHAANSLFFSRTTVLASQVPQIAATLIGNTAALPETAIVQPWASCLRHLGAEIHHVLSFVVSVPDGAALGGEGGHAQTVSSVDDISFDTASAAAGSATTGSPEVVAARDAAIADIKRGFSMAETLAKAASAKNSRDPLPEHIFPKRIHIKLPEYVATLKRLHDEQTYEQKTRHSVAKASLQYLATQVQQNAEDAAQVSAHGGYGDNRERFAAIFRAAFMKRQVEKETGTKEKSSSNQQPHQDPLLAGVGKDGQLSPEVLALASQQIAAGGAAGGGGKDAVKLRQQNEALSMIRERLEFDLAKVDKELKKLRGELSVSQARRKRIERELSEAQGRALTSETSAQKVRNEANTECLEMRQKLVNMQLEIDGLNRHNDELTVQMDVQRVESERTLQAANEAHESRYRDLQAELRVAHNEKSVLQAALEDQTRRIHALEEQNIRADVDKRELASQLADSEQSIDAAQTDAKRVVERSNRARRAEREEHLRLLESGRCATEELVTFEDLRVDRVCASESVYRSGRDGVRSWLNAIGQAQYSSVFEAAGFSDVLSVANIRDEDLQHMRILSGHRRRILASAAELKAHLHMATSKRQTMMPPAADAVAFEQLVENMRGWFRDFEAVVLAEAAEEEVWLAEQQQYLVGGGENLY